MNGNSLLFVSAYHAPVLKILENEYFDETKSYLQSIGIFFENYFQFSNVYDIGLARHGWNSETVIANSALLQEKWASENLQKKVNTILWDKSYALQQHKFLRSLPAKARGLHWVLLEQIKLYRPDVIFIQEMHLFSREFLVEARKFSKIIVGHVSSRLLEFVPYDEYDLILSAVDYNLEYFKMKKIRTLKYFSGFDERMLDFESLNKDIDVIFVGALYSGTIEMLNSVARHNPQLRVYSFTDPKNIENSEINDNYFGPAWGLEMYKLLGRSRIVLNRHGKGGIEAGNMRMFEATGMGATIFTEENSNLKVLFEPGIELETYSNIIDLGAQVNDLLRNRKKNLEVSKAGQLKTLSTHTWANRINLLVNELDLILSSRSI